MFLKHLQIGVNKLWFGSPGSRHFFSHANTPTHVTTAAPQKAHLPPHNIQGIQNTVPYITYVTKLWFMCHTWLFLTTGVSHEKKNYYSIPLLQMDYKMPAA